MPIEHNVLILRIEADRIRQLAKRRAEEYFGNGDGNMLLVNLYAKVIGLSERMLADCDSMETCLKLAEEKK